MRGFILRSHDTDAMFCSFIPYIFIESFILALCMSSFVKYLQKCKYLEHGFNLKITIL